MIVVVLRLVFSCVDFDVHDFSLSLRLCAKEKIPARGSGSDLLIKLKKLSWHASDIKYLAVVMLGTELIKSLFAARRSFH
jgi:hypothetical protein